MMGSRRFVPGLVVSLLVAATVISLPLRAAEPGRPAPDDWQTVKGKHFIVRYRGSSDFAEAALGKAESGYEKIAAGLGYDRRDKFWLWSDRVTICLYATRGDFVAAAGAPQWAVGKANYRRREISSFSGSAGFVDALLPHEVTHLVFRDFIGFKSDVPLWLDEGVAQWFQEDRPSDADQPARALARRNALIPLDELIKMDVRKQQDAETAARFYAESASVVAYLIEKGGADAFVQFCRGLRDGKSFAESLRFTYPEVGGTIAALETNWKKHLAGDKP